MSAISPAAVAAVLEIGDREVGMEVALGMVGQMGKKPGAAVALLIFELEEQP